MAVTGPMNQLENCAFCTLPEIRVVDKNQYGVTIQDGFPVSPGHTLIISRRHVGSFFELKDKERWGLLAMLDAAKARLDREFAPQGYNIGINDGRAAG